MTTLSQLKTRCRERANMESNTGFVPDSELINYINESGKELYDILVQKFTDDYFVSEYDFTTVASQADYSLPSDFYKLLGVDAKLIGDNYYPIRKFVFRDRNKYDNAGTQTIAGVSELRYRIIGSNVTLSPAPTGGMSMKLWYVPKFTELSDDADVLVTDSTWDELIAIDVAIKMLTKEESDISVLYQQKRDILNRIEEAAANRDAGEPDTITDVRGYPWASDDYWG